MSPDLHLASTPASTAADALPSASAGPPIRVVLADGHTQMRRSLRILLEGEDDIEVSGEVGDLGSVTSEIKSEQPQVLVLDLEMRGGSSLEAIGQLRERAPKTQIVASTMEDNPGYAQHALAAGALGFVLKELADEELAPAIRAAAHGEEYISPRIAPGLDSIQRSLTQTS